MEFSLSSILPDLPSLLGGISSESISAGFWVIQILVFSFFLTRLLLGNRSAGQKIRFFKNLLGNTERSQLVAERRSLCEKAREQEGCGELWQDFDESLVMSPDGEHLYNTLDADHFFNSHTLARSVTESRLLAAVPGFLTAVGVIGTFFGLQLGLGALELNTGDTEQLKSGISTLISSASIAFMTSVWGVFLSLLFNVIEKFVEGRLRHDIANLQTRIDELFSRITAERTLLGIESHSKVSRDTLNGLAEQIGERMQVAVQGMADSVTTGMEQSLAKVMEPAIAKLVNASNDLANKQGKSSEDALKKLLEEFSDQLGRAGTEQGDALNKVSEGINSSISQWGDTMSRFMAQLNMTITRLEEMGREQQQAISVTIGKSVSDQEKLSKENADKTRQVIGDLVNGLREEREKENEDNRQRREQNAHDDADRQQKLMDQLASFMEKQNGEVNASVGKTAAMTAELMADLKAQQDAISATIDKTFNDQKTLNEENTEKNSAIFSGLIKGIEADRQQRTRDDEQRRETVRMAEEARQQALMDQLSGFLKQQNDGVNDAVTKTTEMTSDMIDQLNKRIKELSEQDKDRNDSFKKQADSQNQAAREILEEARALNLSVQQVQKGLDDASESLHKTGSELNLAAGRLQQGYERVAQSNESLAGNIAMATNANVQSAKQVDEVSENLHMLMETFEELQQALATVSEQISSGAEISTRSAKDLVHHHQQYRQEMTDTIEHLHEQLSELLDDYGSKVSDQTTDRMQEWNQHTREYTNAMSGVVNVMQDMLEDMESKETTWQ